MSWCFEYERLLIHLRAHADKRVRAISLDWSAAWEDEPPVVKHWPTDDWLRTTLQRDGLRRGTVWYEDGTWAELEEVCGSDYWVYKEVPAIPDETG